MTALALYEHARAALAQARDVDEVKGIRDKAIALRAYARQAEDSELEQNAAEIRLRAERRLGVMLGELKAAGELSKGGRPAKAVEQDPQPGGEAADQKPLAETRAVLTLDEIGVSKDLSSRAQRLSSVGEQAFEAMIARVRERLADRRARGLELLRTADKKARRAAIEYELGGKILALPGRRYGVIYADPEWRFEVYSRETGLNLAADNHYATSSTEEICARPVAAIAADDCVLFLWATVPMLPDALKVLEAWGFAYKSHLAWIKPRFGTGYWFRNQHELLLVGTKGRLPAPAPGEQAPSVLEAPLGRHSEKPEAAYALIERYFPSLPKIELNARRARAGWDAWGAEAPVTADGAPIFHNAETGEVVE